MDHGTEAVERMSSEIAERIPVRHRLKTRLIGVGVMSGIVLAACGAVGLHYVREVAETVAVSTEVTTPLVADALVLSNAGQRAGKIVQDASARCEGVEAAKTGLLEFRTTADALIDGMADLAARAGAQAELRRIDEIEDRFVSISEEVLSACLRTQMINGQLDRANDLIVADVADMSELITALAQTLDREMAVLEARDGSTDEAAARLGAVVRNLWPMSRDLSQFRADLSGFVGFGELVKMLTSSEAIDNLEKTHRERIAGLERIVDRLTAPLDSIGRGDDPLRLRELLADLRERLFGDGGALRLQRAIVDAQESLGGLRERMSEFDTAYFAALTRLEGATRRLDTEAQAKVGASTAEAFRVVLAITLVVLLSALGAAVFLSRRVTHPIERLTRHARRLRRDGDLSLPMDPALTRRTDEVGLLSRSFDRLVDELADARRRLLAESEAEIRRQYERLQAAIGAMPQGLFLLDAEGRLIVHNERYRQMYRLSAEQVAIGTPIEDLARARAMSGAWSQSSDDAIVRGVMAAARPMQQIEELSDGRAVVISASPTPDGGVVVTHEDITERRRVEAEIEHLAHFDVLTGLPNRVTFRAATNEVLGRLGEEEQAALLYVDLDDFKTVNDTLGHPIGDRLLGEVAGRLTAAIGEGDVVSRLGGDEFAVVQTGLFQPMAATDLAARLIASLSEPYEIDGHQIVIGASIGIAVAPDDATESDVLLKNADLALYRAKREGRGVHRFFEPEMDARMQHRRALEFDLRRALDNGEFEVFYQPLVGADTTRIHGFEALLRWHHPERGLVSPADFIPLAEETGLIGAIGAWVLRTAACEAATWPGDVHVAVNISPVQFKNRVLTLDVLAALGVSGLKAGRLELEITEGVLLTDTEATLETLDQLREIGVRIAMDDFGTGYSSLSYLRKFAFDKIKIDQSFVRDLERTADSLAIIRAVTGLCSSLGITTTAEGVETEAQMLRLRAEGCTQLQGYYFGRPMPAADAARLLKTAEEERLRA